MLGVDIGGTKVLAVLVDAQGTVIDRAVAKTQREGPQAVASHVARLVSKLDPDRAVDSLGVGVPGLVVGSTVHDAVNLVGWNDSVDFGALLHEATNRRVVLGNDVEMAARAEMHLGQAKGCANVLHIAVGTGVGGALVIDRQLRAGPRGLAGEIGHTTVPGMSIDGFAGTRAETEPEKATLAAAQTGQVPVCACGGTGHLEAYLGRAGLERRARELGRQGLRSLLVDLAGDRRMTSTTWLEALGAGDHVAQRLIDEATEALAHAITNAATLLDLDLVVIGGGFASRLGKEWRTSVQARQRALQKVGTPPTIKGSALGDNAAAQGAALSTTHQQ